MLFKESLKQSNKIRRYKNKIKLIRMELVDRMMRPDVIRFFAPTKGREEE